MKKIILPFCIFFLFSGNIFADNYSLDFSSGNYARIPMSSTLSNFTDYTMEFWYYETAGHGSDEMIVGTEFFGGSRYGIYSFIDGYWPYIKDNSTFLGISYNGSNPNAGVSYSMNVWNHIAITYDGSMFRFFVNGQLSYSEVGNVNGFGLITEDLVINRHTWGGGGSSSRLSGQLDELRISNVARYTSDFTPPTYEFIPDANTMGLWHFNQDFNDYSGNGNNGTHQGSDYSSNTPDFTDPPPSGNHSLNFDGLWDYILIENPSNFNVDNNQSMTLECWIKSSDNLGNIITNRSLSTNQSPFYSMHLGFDVYDPQSGVAYEWVYATADGNVYGDGAYGANLDDDTWHHVALIRDNETETIRMYLDGILIIQDPDIHLGASTINHPDNYLQIGGWAGPGWNGPGGRETEFINGLIDEVRISNTARYSSDFSPEISFESDENTIALYHFDEGVGTNVFDLSGNGNDGTIYGATWSTDVPTLPSLTSITIDGTSGYRFLSSPVSGTIYGDLLDELWTQGSAGSDMPESSSSNVWTWNNSWNALTDLATDNYTAGSGVLVYVYADTDFDGTDDLPVTLTVDGTQNTSPVTIATNANDWNLLGNPYGLAVSVNQLLTDNSVFNATVYVYDNELTAYKTHNGVTGDLAEGLVSPFSGFWIQAGADGNSFEFTEESIVNSYGSAGRSTTEDETGSAVFTFHYQEHSSSVYLSFSPEGHINLDPADASRLLPMEARSHITSMIHESGKSLSINNLPFDLSTDISMDMDVMMLSPVEGGYTTQEQDVIMEWDLSNIPEGMVFTLLDNTTGQTIDLDALETANITLPNKGILSLESSGFMGTYPELDESQFTLTIQAATTATDVDPVPDVFALHRAYPNPFNPSTLIGYDLPRDSHVSLEIFDLNGRLVKTLINGYFRAGKHQVAWNADQISSGIYLVRLVTGKKVFNQKITYLK